MTALRPQRAQRRRGLLKRHQLAVDVLFAHPARDELRHLGAEIDNENAVVHGDWNAYVRRWFAPVKAAGPLLHG